MITYTQSIFLGLAQGISELFPISSLGHSVILPGILGWKINQGTDAFLTFLVATHFATALILFIYFWRDWKRIITGFFRSVKNISIAGDSDGRLAWIIIFGTIPAGILGLLLQHKFQNLLASPIITSIFLIINGLILIGAEFLSRNRSSTSSTTTNTAIESDKTISRLTFTQSFKIGLIQALALIPGISRTGSALSGGLMVKLDHENAARFAFLLATPLIGAAALLKLPHFLLHLHSYPAGQIFAGAIAAAIATYVSVVFIMNYFKKQTKTLTPFAIYCIVAGLASATFYLFFT